MDGAIALEVAPQHVQPPDLVTVVEVHLAAQDVQELAAERAQAPVGQGLTGGLEDAQLVRRGV